MLYPFYLLATALAFRLVDCAAEAETLGPCVGMAGLTKPGDKPAQPKSLFRLVDSLTVSDAGCNLQGLMSTTSRAAKFSLLFCIA